uniref:Kinase n=1 Tax=Euplotes harpa TaxID=151035 RepID=A0A7S3J858_9SPIT|mmetsp:Transcript_22700/g.26062  ORF Transcript_22700/g.26062 Transcript_22700/m.26062 type:complete len:194 (+) Transcript_22700:420-1001(+)
MENLFADMETYSWIDLKLGTSTGPKHKFLKNPERYAVMSKATTYGEYGFVLFEYHIKNNLTKEKVLDGGKDWLVNNKRDYSKSLTFEQTVKYIKMFFVKYTEDSEHINLDAVKYSLAEVMKMIDFFENYNTLEYRCTSIFIILDHSQEKYVVKLIDISYYNPLDEGLERDENVLLGLRNIRKILQSIIDENSE